MSKKKLRIGVLMGGKSIEREISFNSGRTVCDYIDTARYTIIPLFQTVDNTLYILPGHFLHRGKIADFIDRLALEAQIVTWDNLKHIVDFIFIAMHGRYAEDGILQGLLELLGIPYLGSDIFTSALAMDKIKQKIFLKDAGINVPNDVIVTPQMLANTDTLETVVVQMHKNKIDFPCIVKPHREGSSLGISFVKNSAELMPALEKACFIADKPQAVLIEEKINGMEFSCIVITDYKTGELIPLPPTEIVPEDGSYFFDYEQKYMPGRAHKHTPPRQSVQIIQKIQEICIAVTKTLNIKTIARIDGFLDRAENVIICDPNTFSGMSPSSFVFREAAELNMSHTDLINHLIETELYAYGLLDTVMIDNKDQITHNKNKKMRVAIIMGGRSNEKEISLESGRNITHKLSPHIYQALPLFLSQDLELFPLHHSLLVRNSTKEIEGLIDRSTKIAWHDLPSYADFVFIALHGGEGENGAIQGTLEMLGIPYNGSSVLTSALCMDKYKTSRYLNLHGFDVPKNRLLSKEEWDNNSRNNLISNITTELPYPLIVKPHDDGCSVMVQKAKNHEQLISSIQLLFDHGKEYAFIEECIEGMELTVGVIGNDSPCALPPSQTIAIHDVLSIEEKFLPGSGENQTPAPLPKNTLAFVQKIMENAYQVLDCKGYARIDCFYQTAQQSPTKTERVVIIEINTLPGMTPATCIFHQAAEIGINPMDFIHTIIQLGLEQHANVLVPTNDFKESEL